jgi:hypothetical protein
MWNSGEYGFKDEAALYDHSFQPYGSIWIMNANGTGKRQLTDSHWEDAMPCSCRSNERSGLRQKSLPVQRLPSGIRPKNTALFDSLAPKLRAKLDTGHAGVKSGASASVELSPAIPRYIFFKVRRLQRTLEHWLRSAHHT